jgi:hypothetical protein
MGANFQTMTLPGITSRDEVTKTFSKVQYQGRSQKLPDLSRMFVLRDFEKGGLSATQSNSTRKPSIRTKASLSFSTCSARLSFLRPASANEGQDHGYALTSRW